MFLFEKPVTVTAAYPAYLVLWKTKNCGHDVKIAIDLREKKKTIFTSSGKIKHQRIFSSRNTTKE